ncbi:MAG: DUF1573 domain-containing protein [Sediminibacterium sp.]|nr:DUF1573 domain-containing protein [Sediminibacterium sp.]
MKKIILAFVIAIGFANAGFSQATTNQADISFTQSTFDFGVIPQGTPVTHVFSFKNTGKDPLVLSNVTASCGCTTPEWPKEPVKPGATATIKATYNAASPGVFNKQITIISNAKNAQTILTIKGEVKSAAAQNALPAPALPGAAKKN